MKSLIQTALAAAALGLLAVPVTYAQNVAACQRVEFSKELLERFPKIQESCLDVITRDGQEFAVIKGDLTRTRRDGVTMRIRRPDGSRGDAQFIRVSRDFRVLVDNKPTRVEDLAVGQQLTAYVKVREPMIALEPATPAEPLALTPINDAEAQLAAADTASDADQATMPATAGKIPALGATGLALLLVGGVLAFMRRRGAT